MQYYEISLSLNPFDDHTASTYASLGYTQHLMVLIPSHSSPFFSPSSPLLLLLINFDTRDTLKWQLSTTTKAWRSKTTRSPQPCLRRLWRTSSMCRQLHKHLPPTSYLLPAPCSLLPAPCSLLPPPSSLSFHCLFSCLVFER